MEQVRLIGEIRMDPVQTRTANEFQLNSVSRVTRSLVINLHLVPVKGVCSQKVPDHRFLPFTESGMTPDIIINPRISPHV